jgi:hypothetical protein
VSALRHRAEVRRRAKQRTVTKTTQRWPSSVPNQWRLIHMVAVNPLVVARSQLLTAIDLFFNDRDPISVHALGENAWEILESLCRLAAVEPVTELFLRDHPHKPKRDIYATLDCYRNCFAHVGKTWEERKDGQTILNQFDDGKNEYLLYVCVEDYFRLRGSSPFPMQVFHAWFCAVHVDLIGSARSRLKFVNLFTDLSQMSRYQQKRAALGVIQRSSDDPQVLANPQTEPILIDD